MTEVIAIAHLLATFIKVAGGVWMAWGLITTGLNINERDGGGIRQGLLQCVGAGVVLAGGIYLGTL